MRDRDRRARAIQESIPRILIKDWDPIGIHDHQGMQDEYNSYVGGVYRLLAGGATVAQIAAHLGHIAQVEMGLASNAIHDTSVAGALLELDIALDHPNPS